MCEGARWLLGAVGARAVRPAGKDRGNRRPRTSEASRQRPAVVAAAPHVEDCGVPLVGKGGVVGFVKRAPTHSSQHTPLHM